MATAIAASLLAEMEAASRNAVSSKGFDFEARRIAHLMIERYSLGFVDVGGWDTHMNQGGVSGHLAGRFEELGGSLRGSVVAGEQVKVEQSTLLQNRDFPVLNDDRAVLAGLFARQYGLSAARNE